MSRTNIIATLSAFLVLGLLAACSDSDGPCASDSDCATGQYCVVEEGAVVGGVAQLRVQLVHERDVSLQRHRVRDVVPHAPPPVAPRHRLDTRLDSHLERGIVVAVLRAQLRAQPLLEHILSLLPVAQPEGPTMVLFTPRADCGTRCSAYAPRRS